MKSSEVDQRWLQGLGGEFLKDGTVVSQQNNEGQYVVAGEIPLDINEIFRTYTVAGFPEKLGSRTEKHEIYL